MAVQTISHQDVKTDRHNYIGGSDIAVIMGESRYKTPFQLWCEKTQKLPIADLSNNEAVEMGSKLEQFVANEFSVRTGKTVRRAPKVYTHPVYSYMAAHIDRLVTGTDEILECKTANFFKKDEWENAEIPQEYILQVMWYLGITGRKRGYIAVLIGGQMFKTKTIEFDEELFNLMVEKAKEFWEMVQNDTPPELTEKDNETMSCLYPENNGNIVDITNENPEIIELFETAVAQRQELKMHEKQIKEELTEIENKIKDVIKENDGVKTLKYKVTWKTQKGKYVYNKEAMISDGVFEKYATQGINRVLRVDANKETEVA